MVARHGENRWAERAQQLGGALELRPASAVREIAGSDDDLRLDPLHQSRKCNLDFPLLVCTDVQVGYMEEPGVHDRTRL
jgi:hypothetical protein